MSRDRLKWLEITFAQRIVKSTILSVVHAQRVHTIPKQEAARTRARVDMPYPTYHEGEGRRAGEGRTSAYRWARALFYTRRDRLIS